MHVPEEYKNGASFGLFVVTISYLFFAFVNQILIHITPKTAQVTSRQTWKWRNIMNSLVHSVIAGLWAVASFCLHPQMAKDLINYYSTFAHILVSFSIGYFVHDLIDLARNKQKRSSQELMIHHMFVIVCFGLSVVSQFYIGYSVVALLVETNSIFLHMRQIFIIIGTPKSDFWYRLNSLINIGTFIVFRIMVLGWMTRWLVLHRDDLSLLAYTLGSIGLAVIVLMNIVLFFRICSADFSSKKRKVEAETKPSETASPKSTSLKKEGVDSSSSQSLFSNIQNFHMN